MLVLHHWLEGNFLRVGTMGIYKGVPIKEANDAESKGLQMSTQPLHLSNENSWQCWNRETKVVAVNTIKDNILIQFEVSSMYIPSLGVCCIDFTLLCLRLMRQEWQ